MTAQKFLRFAAMSLAILFVGAERVSACRCAGRVQGVRGYQPCYAYQVSDAVFVGLAEKISVENGRMKISFAVENPIRGVDANTIEIFTRSDTGVCGYPFKKGERYFVYSRRGQDGRLSESLCGPTTLLENAADDLAYHQEIVSGKTGSRIYGSALRVEMAGSQTKGSSAPLAGIEITAAGKKNSFKTLTDAGGRYVFKEIPPDIYRVTAKLPAGLREIVPREDLIDHVAVIHEKDAAASCDAENFVATSQGSMRGKIVGQDGKITIQQKLVLLPLDENSDPLPYRVQDEKWVNRENGEFFFNIVPPGKYLLSINPHNCPYPTDGFPTMFFPGAADKSAARIITVEEGENLRLEDFRVLPTLKEKWFSGAVLFADKTPAANATVVLSDADRNKCNNFRAEVKTDEAGRFRARGYETYQYRITAFIKADKSTGQKTLFSEAFLVPQMNEIKDIELILNKSL